MPASPIFDLFHADDADDAQNDSNSQGISSAYADVISAEMWEEILLCRATVIDPLPRHLAKPYAEAKCELMQHVLAAHPINADNEHDAVQAWMCLIFFDKLVAHAKTDPSVSLNATMRQRLRQALDGDWAYLAHDMLDKWPRDHPAVQSDAKDPVAAA